MAEFPDLLKRIESARAELEALRPLKRDVEERVMQKFRLWWTYHSNAIEGNSLTQGETEMFLLEGLTAKGKPLKDHLDLRGHSDAINYLLELIRAQAVLTEADIRELQRILLVEPYQVPAITPGGAPTMKTVALGQYKTQPNHVRTPTGETHFYATPEETPAKMEDLMTWHRAESARSALHPIEIAARFHHRFTAIHPFDDGNGRMSRLLMNLILMQAHYPPVVIRLGERNQYLAALRRADAGEHEDFLVFIAEHVASSVELFVRAAKGEEIHEPSDLEKEIALLKMELSHVKEPQPRSDEAIDAVYKLSLDPLYAEIVRLLGPLCELFADPHLSIHGNVFSLASPKGMPRLPQKLDTVGIEFLFKGFKKAQFDTFDLAANLVLHFEPLKYGVELRSETPLLLQHFYQESMTRAEITEIAQRLVRIFLEGIKKKTNGLSS